MPNNKFEMKIRQDDDSFVCEITNGSICLCVNDDGEEEDMQAIVDALNKPNVKWYSNNKLELDQHIEIMQLQGDRDQWKAKYDELKCNHEITNAKYSKLLEGYTALKQQHQQLKDRAESYEKVLKDIAKQHKSSEWEQEGDTEYAYDYIINLARKSLPGKEGKV